MFVVKVVFVEIKINMSSPFGGSRIQTQPPERGVFPLDHEGECKIYMKVN